MAYAALVFIAQELELILPNKKDYIHLYENEQIESLHSNVTLLQKLLEDFPGNSSFTIRQLESRITDVAYEFRDIIECRIFGRRYRNVFKHCVEEVNSIAEDATEISKVLEMKKNILSHDSWITSPTLVPSGEDTNVGLDTDLNQIKKQIVGHNSALQIIPIVGMGGIGKTTLAKKVYNDPLAVAHFDVRLWVTISQKYNTQKILEEILGDTEDAESLIVGVHKKLIGRRFLVVMDDIWNAEAWDEVKNAFPDGNNGSRVIVTTRLLEVAVEVGSSSPLHQMQLMSEGQSSELFQKEAFGQDHFPPQLVNIGKIISKNCKGLPLAIVVIARLLKHNLTQDYWEKFARNMNKEIAETHDNQLMEILSLSYDNLPPHLKACFLYTSIFPEDYEIPIKKLIWLWVAEGFVKPTRDKSMEEAAEKYLMDLVERNLISISKKRSNGKIRTCSVHDILRDFSLRKAKEEKFSQQTMIRNTGKTANFTENFLQNCMPWFKDETNSQQLVLYPRRVGVTLTNLCSDGDNTNYGYVYSFTYHSFVYVYTLPQTFRPSLLRVLDVLEVSFQPFIGLDLINLRYLAFTYTSDLNLAKFKNLKTLIVSNAKVGIAYMFFPIPGMPKLKHFVLIPKAPKGYCYYMIDNIYPARICNSVSNSLQVLSGVTNFEFTTDAIKIFANLVKLKIEYQNVDDPVEWERFCLKNVVHLRHLEELTLIFYNYYSENRVPLSQTNVAFSDELKKITITGVIISREYLSAIGSLPNLEVLKLVDCWFESVEWEPVEGEFQLLKFLKLEILNLEEWKVESIYFPCLEHLILSRCHKLKEVPVEVGEIESLQKLVVQDCETNVGTSARKIQDVQRSYGNELQVLVENTIEKSWG